MLKDGPGIEPTPGNPPRTVTVPGFTIHLPPETLADRVRSMGFSLKGLGLPKSGMAFVVEAEAWALLLTRNLTDEQKSLLAQLGMKVD